VFTDAALKFISAESNKPFFAYVAFNAPHSPFQVPEELGAKYAKLDLSEKGFPKIGQPWAIPKLNTDDIAKAYGMIENIDTNFGRLLKALDDKKLTENTVVIFMTDNGTGGVRWNAGLRNRKGTVYEGGIRVPCYIRWPNGFKAQTISTPLAHIDMTPTLLELCGVKMPDVRTPFDGVSFAGMLKGDQQKLNRTLFFQWHRGDEPEKFRAFAVREPQFKLVQSEGVPPNAKWTPKFELFDITADPFEEKDLAADKPDEVARLKKQYETWFADVTKKGFAPPRIIVGSEKENPVRLSRQDWRGPKTGWTADSIGHWEVKVDRAGVYRVTVYATGEFDSAELKATGSGAGTGLFGGPVKNQATFGIALPAGESRFEATVTLDKKPRGVNYVELEYLGPDKKKK
jgi:arylsulfatase A-like enzyme